MFSQSFLSKWPLIFREWAEKMSNHEKQPWHQLLTNLLSKFGVQLTRRGLGVPLCYFTDNITRFKCWKCYQFCFFKDIINSHPAL